MPSVRMRGRECDDEEQQVGGVGSQSRRMRGREKTILSPVCSPQEIDGVLKKIIYFANIRAYFGTF